jgi:conjugative transfer signal peptidase TraF
MMTSRKKILAAMLIGISALVLPATTSLPRALMWNASASVPVGLYCVLPSRKLRVTELVVVAPPEPLASFLAARGYLPKGVPLMKRVLALPGQNVCRTGFVVTVDGISVGGARKRDSRSRWLPSWQGCRTLAPGEVFLMNRESADSVDGRYFGPLSRTSIVGRAVPLWTHGQQ